MEDRVDIGCSIKPADLKFGERIGLQFQDILSFVPSVFALISCFLSYFKEYFM